jgi:DNA-binding CsgD family transcriptional regulator
VWPGESLIDFIIRHAGLTPREFEILGELRTHRSRKEIAGALNCSVRVVAFHASRIYMKFQVRDRLGLLKLVGFKP